MSLSLPLSLSLSLSLSLPLSLPLSLSLSLSLPLVSDSNCYSDSHTVQSIAKVTATAKQHND